jgi:hypothetical protein
LVDPQDSDLYSTQKWKVVATQFLVFGTSSLIAGIFKQMRLLKPWKDMHRFYLVYGMVPTMIVTINETQKSSKLLESLDAKYR